MRAAQFLARAGAPIALPASDVDPGPHWQDGLIVTFWRFVDHDPARADPVLAGRSLRELHDAFAGYDGELPTCDRLDEVRHVLDELPPTSELAELRAFAERLAPLDGPPICGGEDARLEARRRVKRALRYAREM